MTDPFKPSPALLCKLGSALVHADEFLSPGKHAVDRTAFVALRDDPEVKAWLAQMNALAMLPVKRS